MGRRVALGDEVDHLLPGVDVARTEERLWCRAVLAGGDGEATGAGVEPPPREAVRRGADVGLGVGADAHREPLHELAREVLVRVGRLVGVRVQPDEHGRILRHGRRERREVATSLRAEDLVLPVHVDGITDLRDRGRKVRVQQEGQLLLERVRGRQHPAEPPGGEVDELRVQLHRQLAPSRQAHAQSLGRWDRGAERRRRDGICPGVGCAQSGHECLHRGLVAGTRRCPQLVGQRTEAGPAVQVCHEIHRGRGLGHGHEPRFPRWTTPRCADRAMEAGSPRTLNGTCGECEGSVRDDPVRANPGPHSPGTVIIYLTNRRSRP